MKKFYQKGLDITNTKQMFEFLRNHFVYDTMNSWNRLKSIAHNVKVYNLDLDGDCWNALAYLQDDNYFIVNSMIEDWEAEHEGYVVGFNGRSGGYLVLYSNYSNSNILPSMLTDYDTYDEFKEACKDFYGGVKYYKGDLQYYTKLVQDFDKLCDQLCEYVNGLSTRNFYKDKAEYLVESFNSYYESELDDLDATDLEIVEVQPGVIAIKIDDNFDEHLLEQVADYFESDYWSVKIIEDNDLIKLNF